MVKVPLLDLTRTYRKIEPEVTAAVGELLRSQQMILGPTVDRFEKQLAGMCGSRHAVGCASGSDALLLALIAAGIQGGDEVITTPFTFFATAGAIARAGAKPVFADIDPRTFNISPDAVAAALTPNTKAILPVHLYGQSADMDPILDLGRRKGLAVIEDAAQAVGARYHGKTCGTMGIIGCLSFYPSKNLGAAGDAGACLTDDDRLNADLRSLRVHGALPGNPYIHARIGFNSRLDAIQAVILSIKMKHLAEWNETRRRLASVYAEGLAAIEEIETPFVAEGCEHVFHQYVLRARKRDELQAHLESEGIDSRVFYPLPLHLQECFRSLGGRKGDFPESERASREALALPIYPGLTDEEQRHVVRSIGGFYAGSGASKSKAVLRAAGPGK